MKQITDLEQFKHVLPYSSELFGVYQPMLGWRSKRINDRFHKGFKVGKATLRKKFFKLLKSQFELDVSEAGVLHNILSLDVATTTPAISASDSLLMDKIAERLPDESAYNDSVWKDLISEPQIKKLLSDDVSPQVMSWYRDNPDVPGRPENTPTSLQKVVNQIDRESRIGGYVMALAENGSFQKLKELFYPKLSKSLSIIEQMRLEDPFDIIDPHKDLDRVVLSPLGVVHLFRQYFFEFDTFLGTPVGHVWLSPGSSVEMIETSTRRILEERMYENELSSVFKSEEYSTEKEEISSAVKQDNRSLNQMGMNISVNQSWPGGNAQATSAINMIRTQGIARELVHKRMRQQTRKLSSEIRKSFKSSFKTVSEITDTSSKRYMLNNTTDELINYELRRKMRQVGVQVQDVGTYLCWQTYVDDPGRQLGIAELVHLAKSPEVGNTPAPESVPNPEAIIQDINISIPFEPATEDTNEDDMDETYKNGTEVNTDTLEGEPEKVRTTFKGFTDICKQAGFRFSHIDFDYQGADIRLKVKDLVEDPKGKISFSVYVKHVNFRNVSPLSIVGKVHWVPSEDLLNEVNTANSGKVDSHEAQKNQEFKSAFVEAARDRINQASEVRQRKFEDLREEERIAVYRILIQDMLSKHIQFKDDRSRHAVAELLNSIFDVDKMLYFVAPEWWRPRLHQSAQGLGDIDQPQNYPADPVPAPTNNMVLNKESIYDFFHKSKHSVPAPKTEISDENLVHWGGSYDNGRENYYITEESQPARMGSSLGWLLQLDGDRMRNAFLNSPWVKAVIPVRPGKEKAALNWLQRVNVEGADGLDAEYVASPEELAEIPFKGSFPTISDAISALADKIAEKHEQAVTPGRYPTEEINDDNRVSAIPLDKVYEHGFYPNQDGFKVEVGEQFEVFDQWLEVLPTDQIAPVEVKYNPITGRQIFPTPPDPV